VSLWNSRIISLRDLLFSWIITCDSCYLSYEWRTFQERDSFQTSSPQKSQNLNSLGLTDGSLVADTLDGVSDEADDVSECDHPDPFGLVLIPDEQLIDVFSHHDVDSGEKGNGLVD